MPRFRVASIKQLYYFTMKGPLALFVYCLFFSSLFLLFYAFMSPDSYNQYEVASDASNEVRIRSGGGGESSNSKEEGPLAR